MQNAWDKPLSEPTDSDITVVHPSACHIVVGLGRASDAPRRRIVRGGGRFMHEDDMFVSSSGEIDVLVAIGRLLGPSANGRKP